MTGQLSGGDAAAGMAGARGAREAVLIGDAVLSWLGRRAAAYRLTPLMVCEFSVAFAVIAAVWLSLGSSGADGIAVGAAAAGFLVAHTGRLLAGVRPAPAVEWGLAACGVLADLVVYAGLATSVSLHAVAASQAGLANLSLQGTFVARLGGATSTGAWRLAVAAAILTVLLAMVDVCAHARTEPGIRLRLFGPPGDIRLTMICAAALLAGVQVAFLTVFVLAVIAFGVTIADGMRSRAAAFRLDDPPYPTQDLHRAGGALYRQQGAFQVVDHPVSPEDAPRVGDSTYVPRDPAWTAVPLHGEIPANDEPPVPPTTEGASPGDDPGYSPEARLMAEDAAESGGQGGSVPGARDVRGYRGDGRIAVWIGSFVRGRLLPLPPLLVGLLVTGVLTALGLRNLTGILVLTPVEAMLLAAFASWHPHDGRSDWLVPPLLQAAEYVFIAEVGFAGHVAPPLTFALVAAAGLRHLDLAYRARGGLSSGIDRRGLGWEGRMLVVGIAAAVGVQVVIFAALTVYLWWRLVRDWTLGWSAGHATVDR